MDNIVNKKSKTKQKIIDCFWELYRQKSIDKITVSELASLAKINRSTFYVYFNDIYDVLEQIEEDYLPDGIKFIEKCHGFQDKDQMYQIFLDMFDKVYPNFTYLVSEQGDPNFVTKLKNSIRPVFKSTIPEKYQNNKYFDLTVEYVLSSMISVITYWATHTSDITSRELFDHLHNLYVFGVPASLDDNWNHELKPHCS